MNAAPTPDDSDEQFESVAESLLGVDFTTPADLIGPLDLDDDDDLFGDEPVDEPEFSAEEPVAGEERPGSLAEPDAGDEFGFGVEEPAGSEAPLRRGPSSPKARDDSYWDALEGWDWDEGAGTAGRTEEPPTRTAESGPDQPEVPEISSPAAARKTEAFREDDDFGAGLVEEAPAASARTPPSARGDRVSDRQPSPERTPERESEGRRPRGGDRDEGRRSGRSGRRDEGRGGRGRRGRDEERPRREHPPAPPRVSEPEAARDEVSDFASEPSDFGAGLDVAPPPRQAAAPEGEPRRGRRRRGRGRGRNRGAPEGSSADAAPVQGGTPELDYGPEHEFEPVDDLGERDEPDPSEEFGVEPASFDEPESPIVEAPVEDAEPRFADVPTWAEAISYLFNPKVRSSSRSGDEGTRGGEGESRGGSRRSSGGERGRRGGPRRGGGRGRRSSGPSD